MTEQTTWAEAMADAVEVPPPPPAGLTCPYCPDGTTSFGSLAGAKAHLRHKHPEEAVPEEWAHARKARGSSNGHRPAAPMTPPPPTRDLRAVEEQLTQSIGAVGGILAGLLGGYKDATVKYQAVSGQPLTLPLINRPAPYLETTFGHVIVARAPLSSRILMSYAETNPTLLALIEGFNHVMTGGEVGGLVADHAIGLAHTLAPTSKQVNTAAAWRLASDDVLGKVMEENALLQAEVDALRRQAAAASGATVGADERGSGNV